MNAAGHAVSMFFRDMREEFTSLFDGNDALIDGQDDTDVELGHVIR